MMSPTWAEIDYEEDDYSEESNAEIEEIVDYDEWNNPIYVVDGFLFSDIDEKIESEKDFESELQYLFYTNKNIPRKTKKENIERVRNEREAQKNRSQSIHDRIVAALEDEKRRLSTNTI